MRSTTSIVGWIIITVILILVFFLASIGFWFIFSRLIELTGGMAREAIFLRRAGSVFWKMYC